MQGIIEFFGVAAATVIAWRMAARYYREKGRSGLLSHLVGFGAGLLAFIVTMLIVVKVDPPPPETSSPQTVTGPEPTVAGPPKDAEPKTVEKSKEAAPAEPNPESTAMIEKESLKARLREFEKNLTGYDAVGALALKHVAAAMKGGNAVEVYGAAKEAQQYAMAAWSATSGMKLPEGLPEEVEEGLTQVKEVFASMFLERQMALDSLMEYLDTSKPSAAHEFQQFSQTATLKAADAVVALLKAKKAAGFTDEEIAADLKAASGEPSRPAQKEERRSKARTK